MTRLITFVALVSALLCGVRTSTAQPAPASESGHVGVGVKMTTLGVAIEAAVPIASRVNVRAGFNVLGLSHDFDDDGIVLTAQLHLRSFNTYVDLFPFGGGFHVSPGLMLYNGNEVNALATVPGGRQFSLGGSSFVSNPSNPVTGVATIGFERVAPAIMLGWGNMVPRGGRRWAIPFEIGIVYSRAPTATFILGGSACLPNGTNCRNVATDPTLQAEVRNEQNQMNDDLSFLKILPVVSIGFSYRF